MRDLPEKTFTCPPREIFSVLHAAEAHDIEIPDIVDKWWEEETNLSIEAQEALKRG